MIFPSGKPRYYSKYKKNPKHHTPNSSHQELSLKNIVKNLIFILPWPPLISNAEGVKAGRGNRSVMIWKGQRGSAALSVQNFPSVLMKAAQVEPDMNQVI